MIDPNRSPHLFRAVEERRNWEAFENGYRPETETVVETWADVTREAFISDRRKLHVYDERGKTIAFSTEIPELVARAETLMGSKDGHLRLKDLLQ